MFLDCINVVEHIRKRLGEDFEITIEITRKAAFVNAKHRNGSEFKYGMKKYVLEKGSMSEALINSFCSNVEKRFRRKR